VKRISLITIAAFAGLGWIGVIVAAALSGGTPADEIAGEQVEKVLQAPEPQAPESQAAAAAAQPAVVEAAPKPEPVRTTADDLLIAAKKALDSADYVTALAQFERAALNRPTFMDDAEFLYYCAEALKGAGDLIKAAGYYAKLMEVAPQHRLAEDAAFSLVKLLIDTAQLDQAVAAVNRVAALYPHVQRTPDALASVARALEGAGRWADAALLYKRLVADHPEYGEPGEYLYRAGRVLWDSGDAAAAMEPLARACEIDGPYRNRARYYLGAGLYRLERFEEAIGVFQSASVEGWTPNEIATALYWSGMCYQKLGRYPEAAAAFSQLVESYRLGATDDSIISAVARGGYMLGDALYGACDYKAALVAYKRALDYAPEGRMAPWGAYRMGVCLRRMGRPLEAKEAFDKVAANYAGTFWAEQAQWDAGDIAWQMKNGLVAALRTERGGRK